MSALAVSEPTIMIEVRCQCPGNPRIPLRLTVGGLTALRSATQCGALNPLTVLATHYCRRCQVISGITFRDLLLT